MANTILAADLGKFNSVLCWYEPEIRSTAFRTVRTCEEELRRELFRQPVVQVVFEASPLRCLGIHTGIEFADWNSRFVGTERFLRRRG